MTAIWAMLMSSGYMHFSIKTNDFYVWPVRDAK